MKNNCNFQNLEMGRPLWAFAKKIPLVMKLFIICLFCSIGMVQAVESYAQNARISLKVEEETVADVLKEIEEASEFDFFYNNTQIDLNRRVSVSAQNSDIFSILEDMFAGTKVRYTVLDKKIILSTELVDNQQQPRNVVKGKVIDAAGEPVIGATVKEVGTNNGIVTDIDGNFSLAVQPGASLEISFVGYKTESVQAVVGKNLVVRLKEDNEILDEVVVIGYGTTTIKSNTGSITSVKSTDIKNFPSSNFASALSGKATGVQIIQSSADPGNYPKIRVRGTGTLTAGSSPLIIVDGFPLSESSDINSIANPNAIESIEILKDAASTAIYGSRGANGIIMITTKSGKTGKPNVTLSANFGIQQRSDKVRLVDAYDFAQFLKEARNTGYVNKDPLHRKESDSNAIRKSNGASKRELIPDYILPYLEGKPGLTNTDWYDEIFRVAPMQDYNITVNGGSEKASYSFTGGYMKQNGIVIGSDMDKFSVNINLRFNPVKRLTMGLSISPSYTKINGITSNGWGGSLNGIASISYPFFSPYNEDGSYAISEQIAANQESDGALCENPVAWANMITNKKERTRVFGNFYTELKLFDFLKYKLNLGSDYNQSTSDYFNPSSLGAYRVAAPKPTEASQERGGTLNYLIENTLNFNKSFFDNANNIQMLLGQSYQKEEWSTVKINATGFTDDSIENIAGGSSFKVSPNQYAWAMISYFARLNYNYMNKYMLNASIRWDGSSRFGKNSKWGMFPAVSAAWLISSENFLRKSSFIEFAKLRVSWGKSGNNQIPNFGAQATMTGSDYINNGGIVPGVIISASPNPDLSWEMTSTFNIGLDLTLFKYLGINADFYVANTNDLLLNVPVPEQSGYSTSLQNIGKVRNTGFELKLSTAKDISLGSIAWNSSFSLSTNKNKVLALAPGQKQIISGVNITKVGSSISELYGYKVIGIYKTEEDFKKYPAMAGTQIGDYIIADLNNDKKIDTKDKRSFGTPAAEVILGFNNIFKYKNLELTFDIYGEIGKKKYNSTLASLESGEGFMMVTQDYFDNRFHPINNPNGTYATPNMANYSNDRKQAATSSLWYQNASFLSLRNLKLAYNLPKVFVEKIGLNQAQIYVLGNNLFMFTPYKGFNIDAEGNNILEQGKEHYAYPMSRMVSIGINVSF